MIKDVSLPPVSDTEGIASSIGPVSLPNSDDEDGSDEDNELEEPVSEKISGKAAQKLIEELPVVSNKGLPASRAAGNKVKTVTATTETKAPSATQIDWVPRSDITLEAYKETTRSYKLCLKSQNSDIRGVINRARILGVIMLVSSIDSNKCPVSKNLRSVALTALVKAADQLGYDGEGDIADRLERGDILKYIKPMAKYTAGRISLERKLLKSPSSTVLAALKLDNSPRGRAAAGKLIQDGDYIYGLSSGKYDYQSPFQNEVMHKYMSDMFWGNNKLALLLRPYHNQLFVSSQPDDDKAKLELEIPGAMLVLSACAIHAILLDHSLGTNAKFPPVGLQRQWDGYVGIFENMKRRNKVRAHKILHGMYLKASHSIAPAAQGLSEDQIISRVNWDAFDEDVEEDGDVVDDEGSNHVEQEGNQDGEDGDAPGGEESGDKADKADKAGGDGSRAEDAGADGETAA
ncbi:hypothetical protein D9758_017423 [Tetrapyrgos nigripes]|uniref:DUF6532 domain-containing protein n=1 Tax=Tetrapyrgos nigripes TaxID=182062 RepID=A0A8H5FES9_9AGAR|nr:hypothetical protein D9758_017423 [Tetrapyrgos nigripes]